MKQTVSQEDIISAIQTATRDVFSTMLNLPLEDGQPRDEADEPHPFDGVIALVGVAGSWTGTGRISCSPHFACELAGALLMATYESVDEDVLDAVSEVANMIIGNVKTSFEERLGPLGLSIPTVIFGRNYQTRSAGVQHWTVVPFHSNGKDIEVRFCLMPSRDAHSHVPQPESLQTA